MNTAFGFSRLQGFAALLFCLAVSCGKSPVAVERSFQFQLKYDCGTEPAKADELLKALSRRIQAYFGGRAGLHVAGQEAGKLNVEVNCEGSRAEALFLLQNEGRFRIYECWDNDAYFSWMVQANSLAAHISNPQGPDPVSSDTLTHFNLDSIARVNSASYKKSEFSRQNPMLSLLAFNNPGDSLGTEVFCVNESDTAAMNRWLKRPEIAQTLPEEIRFAWSLLDDVNNPGVFRLVAISSVSAAGLTEANLMQVHSDLSRENGDPLVSIGFDEEGARIFREFTFANQKRYIALLVDDRVILHARVENEVTDGNVVLRGGLDFPEARKLAAILGSGALPCKVTAVE